jgi:hypothetical protein
VIDVQCDDSFFSEHDIKGVEKRDRIRASRKADECFSVVAVKILLLIE